MPSIRDHIQLIDQKLAEVVKEAESGGQFHELMQEAKVAIAQLAAMSLQTVTRYDYWRRAYCTKSGMSESEFDAMTDKCISYKEEPEEACKHLVVTPMGRCANCGKRV